MAIDWNAWRPRLLYSAFFAAAFVFALRQTLPVEAAKERLILEAARQGWQVTAGDAGPAGMLGLSLKDVVLKDREGLSVRMDQLDVTVPLGGLLAGKKRVALEARLYDGLVHTTLEPWTGPRTVAFRAEHVDLGQALPLRKAAGADLEGVLTGQGRFTLPADEKGKPAGELDLTVKGAGLAAGKLALGPMGALTVPRTGFGDLVATAKLDAGKGTFEKLSATGGDVELRADGLAFTVQQKLEYAPLFGKATVKASDAFLQKPEVKSVKPLLDAALGGAGPAGWSLQITGSLGHPQVGRGAAGGGPALPGAPAPIRPVPGRP